MLQVPELRPELPALPANFPLLGDLPPPPDTDDLSLQLALALSMPFPLPGYLPDLGPPGDAGLDSGTSSPTRTTGSPRLHSELENYDQLQDWIRVTSFQFDTERVSVEQQLKHGEDQDRVQQEKRTRARESRPLRREAQRRERAVGAVFRSLHDYQGVPGGQ